MPHPTPRLEGPAIYRIRVQGRVDGRWSDYFGGLNVTEVDPTDDLPETILVGRLADQSALAGVLDTLHEHHLSIVSVDCLEVG